jgi:hypothetical protein
MNRAHAGGMQGEDVNDNAFGFATALRRTFCLAGFPLSRE